MCVFDEDAREKTLGRQALDKELFRGSVDVRLARLVSITVVKDAWGYCNCGPPLLEQGMAGTTRTQMTCTNPKLRLLTPQQVATRLQVDIPTVEMWCEQRLISCIRLPDNSLRFNGFDVSAFIGRHRVNNT
jgi:hypothetical protein